MLSNIILVNQYQENTQDTFLTLINFIGHLKYLNLITIFGQSLYKLLPHMNTA